MALRVLHLRRCWLLCSVLFALPLWGAEAKWLRLRTPNFEMYSALNEKQSREAILYFEQVHHFFTGGVTIRKDKPVQVVVFRGEKDFRPYAPNQIAAAYYLGAADRDYIVMRNADKESYPIAIHEYVHLLTKHMGKKYPLWLNEGLAEFFATLQPRANKVLLGGLHDNHLAYLQQEKLIDLPDLFAADSRSPLYNERGRAGVLYAQSWALVHMLYLDKSWRPKYQEWEALVTGGTPAADAFRKVYGVELPQVRRNLEGYIRSQSFMGALVDARFSKTGDPVEVAETSRFETDLVLASMMSVTFDRQEQGKALLLQLAQQQPGRVEVQERLAELFAREEPEKADSYYAKAVELGSKNPYLYLRYAYRQLSLDPPRAKELLRKALELDNGFIDARLLLAQMELKDGHHVQTISLLSSAGKITPDKAYRVLFTLGQAQARAGGYQTARDTVQRARQYAREESEKVYLQEFERYLDRAEEFQRRQKEAKTAAAALPVQLVEDEALLTPEVKPDTPAGGEVAPREFLVATGGRLKRLDCLGSGARLVLDVNGKELALLISDPQKVELKGTENWSMDFTCGPQPPKPVKVRFAPDTNVKTATAGHLRVLQFE